jgi:demethylmenaquinone methyltransferase/2-methoxy-6-polyprenyl-1,4-benzoquinol methylase
VLSGGLDFFWRRRAAKIVAGWKPASILDLATGSGDLALTLEKFNPQAAVVGADFSEEMLLRAKAKGLRNTVLADALHLPFDDASFDAVTVAYGLRNMASWPDALREMRRVLRDCGHVLVLDFSIPTWQPLCAIYRLYLHGCLPFFATILTGKKSAYRYLADSIETFPQGGAMTSLLNECGFSETKCERLSGGIVSLYTGRAVKTSPN